MQQQQSLYTYRATVVKIIDGDTLNVDIDLGLDIIAKDQKLRLYGINTAELKSRNPEEKEKANKAKERLSQLCPVGSKIVIKTLKDKQEKYGRLLAIVYSIDNREVNKLLVEEGLASEYLTNNKE